MQPISKTGAAQFTALSTGESVAAVDIAEKRRQLQEWIRSAIASTGGGSADAIKIKIAGPKVTITGGVNSWAQLRAVVQAAKSAPGIRLVDEQLRIERS